MEKSQPEYTDTTEQRQPPRYSRRALLALGIGVAALAMTACTEDEPDLPMPEFIKSREKDLLTDQTWHYMPGAEHNGDHLQVRHMGLAIITNPGEDKLQDIPDMPVNAYGTHIEMAQADGDIGFAARLTDIHGKATISFQSEPTFRYDERLYRHAGVDVEIEDNIATIKVHYGDKDEPNITKRIKLDAPITTADIKLAQTNNSLILNVNGKDLVIGDSKVFESGSVWFGMDATESWKLDDFKAYALGKNQIETVDTSKQTLGELDTQNGLQAIAARHRPDLAVECAVNTRALYDPELARLLMAEFGGLSMETEGKTQAWRPAEGLENWHELDALMDIARRHNKKLHGHTSFWYAANPKWIHEKLATLGADEAVGFMREHLQLFLDHCGDMLETHDLINEPFGEGNVFRPENPWTKPFGDDEIRYMVEAFTLAREIKPNGKFGINEYGLETNDPNRRQAMFELLDTLAERGVKPDYIGIQMHVFERGRDDVNFAALDAFCKELAERGIGVRFSEISVLGSDPEFQAAQYRGLLEVALHNPNVISYCTWGAASNETYFTTWPDKRHSIGPEQYGDDAPWQKNRDGTYSPKLAASEMKQAA